MSPTTIPGTFILQSPASNDPLLDLNTQPSLDLQFATGKTLNDRVSGNNLITFSRADATTCATYVDSNGVIQTAAANVPRFDHDPVTGESLGLLIEEGRTNLLRYSEEFDNGAWIKNNAAVTQNSTVSPDGTATADKFVWTNTATIAGSITRSSTDRGTATNPIVIYTLTGTGTATVLSTLATGSNYDIDPVGNGWYRCWLYDSTAGQTLSVYAKAGEFDKLQLQFYISNRYIYVKDSVATQGDGTSGIYIWGAQLEAGSFPTSYIPTTGATVTRAADVASITGTDFTSFYNQSEGTWFGEVKKSYPTQQRLLEVGDSSNNYYSVSIRPGATSTAFARQASSSSYVNHTYPAKFACADSVTDIRGCVNGTLSALITTGSSPTDDTLVIGGVMSATTSANAISRLAYYPYRLADATLQEITS